MNSRDKLCRLAMLAGCIIMAAGVMSGAMIIKVAPLLNAPVFATLFGVAIALAGLLGRD